MIAVKLEPAWQAFESEGKGNAGTCKGDGRRGTSSEIIIIIIIVIIIISELIVNRILIVFFNKIV